MTQPGGEGANAGGSLPSSAQAAAVPMAPLPSFKAVPLQPTAAAQAMLLAQMMAQQRGAALPGTLPASAATVPTPAALAALAPVATGVPSTSPDNPGSTGGGGRGSRRGGRGAGRKSTPKQSPAGAADEVIEVVELPSPPKALGKLDRTDPGGRLVWAKVGDYPWWPAKEMDEQRDASFPPGARPPRPNMVPVRFLGTYEFEWMGLHALKGWQEGLAAGFATADDQQSLREAVAEVEAYQRTGILPDVFYIRLEPKRVKRKQQQQQQQQQQQPKRRGGVGGSSVAPAAAAAAAAAAAHLPPEQAAELAAQRQKRIRQQLGLQPPDGSLWTRGRMCPNPLLDAKLAEWRAAGLLPARGGAS